MPTLDQYVAFWSYTRFDDENDGSWLTRLREILQTEIRAQSGMHAEIFQDADGILWGQQWQERLRRSADAAAFLVPIVTPSYFRSNPCRSELEQFILRENNTGFREFILPLYYITCPKLEDQFLRSADQLAKAVADLQYFDIRSFRHQSFDFPDTQSMVRRLATQLLGRFNGFVRHHLASDRMKAYIALPRERAPVPNKVLLIGTLGDVPDWINVWLVVEGGSKYHPQRRLPKCATAWQESISIGRSQPGCDANCEFPVHVIAVPPDVDEAFERYLSDANKTKTWRGVSRPPGSKILATIRIVRDDSASKFDFLAAAYQERTSDGKPTGGVIHVTNGGPERFTTAAQNPKGEIEWSGSFDVLGTNPLSAKGTYSYSAKTDSGEHHLIIDAASGDLQVDGQNTSDPMGKSFRTIWRRI